MDQELIALLEIRVFFRTQATPLCSLGTDPLSFCAVTLLFLKREMLRQKVLARVDVHATDDVLALADALKGNTTVTELHVSAARSSEIFQPADHCWIPRSQLCRLRTCSLGDIYMQ